jgi:hypothetical protein
MRRQQRVAPIAGAASRLKRLVFTLIPWVDTHGYLLPSLRDSGNAQLQKA